MLRQVIVIIMLVCGGSAFAQDTAAGIAQERVTASELWRGAAGYEPFQQAWTGWVNFEPERERRIVPGSDIGSAYAEIAGGVRFVADAGAVRLQECGFNLNQPSRCQYPAPEGRHAAFAPGSGFSIVFDQPAAVAAFDLSPGPTDATRVGEAAVFEVTALMLGDPVATVRVEAEGFQDNGEGWASVQIPAEEVDDVFPPDRFTEIRIRAFDVQGTPVRAGTVIDALRFLRNAPREEAADDSPFAAAGPVAGLDAAFERTARIRDVFQGSRIVELQQTPEGGLFPVPERRRVRVDLAAARADAQRQRSEAGVATPVELSVRGAEQVMLPILAPLNALADPANARGLVAGADLIEDRDTFHLYVPTEHGTAVIRGSRVLTVTPDGARAPGPLRISYTEYGAVASFNLYGAAYGVEIACVPSQPICSDPAAMQDFVDRLFIFVGGAR